MSNIREGFGVLMKSASTIALAAVLIAVCGCDRSGPAAAAVAAAPQHPDFSGIWFPAGRQQDPQRPEFTPGAAAAAAAYEKAFTLDDDPGRYCQWPGMPRAVWIPKDQWATFTADELKRHNIAFQLPTP